MIYIIRHGQTEKNKANLLQGRSEHPLNETGILQAKEAGEWFASHGIVFDAVYSSPLERAKDTGRIAAFLEEIRERAEAEEILVSTHAIAMKGALEYLTPGSNGAYWSKYIGNCAVYAVPVKDGKFGVPYEIRA